MEKGVTQNEWRLQELAETKSFIELTSDEEKFVLSMTTQQEYVLMNNILREDSMSDADDNLVVPLVVPGTFVSSNLIYKGLLALSLAVIALLLFTPILNKNIEIETVKYLAVTDTVFETQVVTDTFYKTHENIKYIDRPVYLVAENNCPDPTNQIVEEPRLLEVMNTISAPDFSVNTKLKSNKESMDRETDLVFDFSAVANF